MLFRVVVFLAFISIQTFGMPAMAEMSEQNQGASNRHMIQSLYSLAATSVAEEKYVKAESLYLEVIDILAKENKIDIQIDMNIDVDSEIRGYTTAARLNPAYVVETGFKVFKALAEIPDPEDLEIKNVLQKLATLYRKMGNVDLAEETEIKIIHYERMCQYKFKKKELSPYLITNPTKEKRR